MDSYNHLEFLIKKNKFDKILYLPIQNNYNYACTYIIFEAIKRSYSLVENFFEDECKFKNIYNLILEEGEKNRQLYGEHKEGDDPTDSSIKLLYPEIDKNINDNGGYKSIIYVNDVYTDINSLESGLTDLTKPGKFMIIRRDGSTFLLLSIAQNKGDEYGNNVLVIDTHFPCTGVLSFEDVINYVFQNGLYSGEYLFGLGDFTNYNTIPEPTNNKKNSMSIII